jgi:FMN phosphatase YigB (HAD superfamily)
MLKEFRAIVDYAAATERPAASRRDDGSPLLQQKLAGCPKLDLISFDVFDTVMTRSVGEPSSLFYLLGEQLLERGILRGSAESFALARESASHRARDTIKPPADVTLAGIYDELVHGLPYLRDHVAQMMAAELELERALSRPMPGAAAMIELARGHTGTVAFVSDMYLPEDFIRELLLNHELARPEDPVYVSNARGCMKARGGKLFDYVLAKHGADPGRALHVGDKEWWDYTPARARGMHALLLPYGLLNRYEQALEQRRWESRGLTSIMAGASRLARLHGLESGSCEAVTDVLAGVAGPLLCGFTIWLIEHAQSAGLQRLYFLSREGELIYELACIVNERYQLGLELRYLHVSRRSLNFALLTDPSEDNLEFSLTSTRSFSLRGVLDRIRLEPEDIETELQEIGLFRSHWDSSISPAQYDQLLTILRGDRAPKVLVERATEARIIAEHYLEAQGMFENLRIGLVDTTGVGSQLRALHLLRKSRTNATTLGFLAVRNWWGFAKHDGFPPIYGYLADHHAKRGYGALPGVVAMLEVFTRTDHGMVLGYRWADGAVEPILDTGEVDHGEEWEIQRMRGIVKAFMREVVGGAYSLGSGRDARAGLTNAFQAFWENPTADEAKFWGGYQFELGSGNGDGFIDLAPRFTITDVFARCFGNKRAFLLPHWFTWHTGRERRSPRHVRAFLGFARFIQSAAHRVRRFINRGVRRARTVRD